MNTPLLSQQIEAAGILSVILFALYLLPSNEEIATRFRAWKRKRSKNSQTAKIVSFR